MCICALFGNYLFYKIQLSTANGCDLPDYFSAADGVASDAITYIRDSISGHVILNINRVYHYSSVSC